jgi:hypothetical protein
MGEYKENTRVAQGPFRTPESYGSDRDKVKWAMLSSDKRSPFSFPDRNDAFVMTSLVTRSESKKKKRK